MWEWLVQYVQSMTWERVLLIGICAVFAVALSYGLVIVVLVKLPSNYFHSDRHHHFLPETHPVLRTAAIVAKNILGVVLMIAGVILSFPAVPGPGLVTLLIGLMITDIPGKRKLEAKIIQRPMVFAAVNKLRARYNKPALVID